MNLFIVGWKLPEEHCSRVLSELQRMTEIYPQLDPKTIWHHSSTNGSIFAASMHTDDQAAAPRRYVIQNDNEVVFFSGLPVNSMGSYPAHSAEALSSHWSELTETLEGMFCIIRASHNPPASLELLTDIIGMEQVFYYHQDNLWLISNNVRLIERTSKKSTLDPLGISLFLNTGWVGDDCTLRSNIRVIPGGQHWIWKEGDSEPRQQNYYNPTRLARLPHKALTPKYLKQISDSLIQTLQSLNQGFEQITCALTGGRDTRFVTSLLIHTGLPVHYYTFGEPSGTDRKIAALIADIINLPYKFVSIEVRDIMENWDTLCEQIISQSDGMANIDGIPGVIASLSLKSGFLRLDLGGTGGPISKGLYSTPDLNLFLNKYDITSIKRYLANQIVSDYGGLLNREGVELARDSIYRFVTKYTDYGFNPVDIPDVFYLYSNLPRRRGINKRALVQYQDFFSPFFCRSFIEATFSLPAYQRCLEPLHYHIINFLSPKLHRIPSSSSHTHIDKYCWYNQHPIIYLIQYYEKRMHSRIQRRIRKYLKNDRTTKEKDKVQHMGTDMFDQTSWFNAKRDQIGAMCLDNNHSLIWQFVNRSNFEKITSLKTDTAELFKYKFYITQFFRIATLFYYERYLNNLSQESSHFIQ